MVATKLSRRYTQIFKALLNRLPGKSLEGIQVLDIGDYKPVLPMFLKAQEVRVTVLDLDFTEEKQQLYTENNIEFVECDLNNINNQPMSINKKYDLVIWLEVIEHLVNPIYVFEQLHRILKDDGLLVIGTPNAARLSSRLRLLFGRHPYEYYLKPFYFGGESFVGHRREYLIHEINSMLKWEGFEILDKIYFNGSLEDHKKQSVFLSLPYLTTTRIFPKLRWLYICIAQKKGQRPKPMTIKQKRA